MLLASCQEFSALPLPRVRIWAAIVFRQGDASHPEGFEGCRINIEVTTARSGSFSDSEYIPALK